MGRILAISDIHGCAKTLESLIDQIELTHEDKLFFLGDYLDRGNKSFEVIEFLINLKESYPDNVYFLKGNHDVMFLNFLEGEDRMAYQLFMMNGGKDTIRSYQENLRIGPTHDDRSAADLTYDDLPESHKAFFKDLQLYIEYENYVFVHAGVYPGVPLAEQTQEDLTWIRYEFLNYPTEPLPGKIVVHGHTVMTNNSAERNAYETMPGRVNCDYGCVFGYALHCVDLTNGEVFAIFNRD